MPLGDPKGDFQYTFEGLPETVACVEIPVSDVSRSVLFYKDTMKMDMVSSCDKYALLKLRGTYVKIKKCQTVGIDTGIYIGVRDPFEFHRRMVDENVMFIRHPEKGDVGVYASFKDPDGNVIHVMTNA